MATVEYKFDKLSAKNYSTWRTVIKSHLMSKDLWDYVVESKIKDDEDKVGNEKAKHLMYVSMEPSQIAATGVCETAHDLWLKIRENHEGAEANLQSTTLAEFLGMKYRKNESLVSFAGRYELTLGRLQATDHKIDERTKLWVFSNSLPQYLKQTVHMFNMASPNGTVSELISQLKIQHHFDSNDGSQEASAFHLKDSKSHNDRHKNKFKRTDPDSSNGNHSNNTGGSNSQNNKRQVTCNYCSKPGHVWRECRKYKNDNDRKKKFGQLNSQHKQDNNQYQQESKKSGAFTAKTHEHSEGKHSWIVDSGASSHMTPYRDQMSNYIEFATPRDITLGDGKKLAAYGSGLISFRSKEFTGVLESVLWVPEICENLFSVCRATKLGCSIVFKRTRALFYRDNQLVLVGEKKAGSTYFLIPIEPTWDDAPTSTQEDSALIGATLDEWHERLAHCSIETVKTMIKNGAADGLVITSTNPIECRPCVMGKLCRTHHPDRNKTLADERSAVLHIDTVGPFQTPSLGGARYFVLATEEYSGYKFIDTIGTKAFVPDCIKRIINLCELESHRPVKAIVTDCGSEYTANDIEQWLETRGIVHFYAVPYTPQQNGMAERANRTILDATRTLLSDSRLPEELWAEAVRVAVYTTNRLVTSKRPDKTRYELMTGKKPNLSNLRRFGQRAIIRTPDVNRTSKLSERGEEVTLVGYGDRHNTYRFYVEEPYQQVIESCDAKFINTVVNRNNVRDQQQQLMRIVTNDKPEHSSRANKGTDDPKDSDENYQPDETDQSDSDTVIDDGSSSDSGSYKTVAQTPRFERIATRQHTRSLQQNKESNSDGPAVVGVHEGALFTIEDEPRTLNDAQSSENWQDWKRAMEEEIQALKKNETWVLVDPPPRVKPIKSKWIFKRKLKPNGEVERYKARLVAKGYTQVENIDYKETYAPVAGMTTIRMFLAISCLHSMNIIQFDIKTAFLYGELEELLFMEQPEGFSENNNKVCKLVKSLYGLKQAPRMFNKKFDSFLKLFNLKQATFDKCLYFNEDHSLLLTIYVDDGLVAGTNQKQLNDLITHLRRNFELKVSDCESFLGIRIIRDKQTLSIIQDGYIERLLEKFGMLDCKAVGTPEQVGVKFEESEPLPTENKFKELVGSLLYLATCTRPDISHAVSVASRTSQPTQSHWIALKRILRYLKGTKDYGIGFRWENASKDLASCDISSAQVREKNDSNELVVYSDADFANEEKSRKSTTGMVTYFAGGPIAWLSQLQPIITLSTTEAEFVAGCEAVKRLIPIRNQLIELKEINAETPTTIFIDNQSTVRIATNEGSQSRTKHIDIRAKWLTEQSEKGTIRVQHVSGTEQAADIMTKPLYKTKFINNRSKLLTKLIISVSLMAILGNIVGARILKPADPLSTVQSDYVYIRGDTRFKMFNTFINPCEILFNDTSSTISLSETLTRNCVGYYEKKLLSTLPNCKQLPTIGPELKTTVPKTDCEGDQYVGTSESGEPATHPVGKCEIKSSGRTGVIHAPPLLKLSAVDEGWMRHKKRVNNLPIISRQKRILPLFVAVGAAVVSTISIGGTYKALKLAETNRQNIEILMNVTNEQTRALKESDQYLEDYRDHVVAVTTWGRQIEELLGFDRSDPRFTRDPIFRGKKANLVNAYVQWFDSQSKLLSDINAAAKLKKVPASLQTMVNLSTDFETATNWSNLFDCNYQIVNKSLTLELDFTLPTIDNNIEILNIVPVSFYDQRPNDSGQNENCWIEYTGPQRIMRNKTNDCIIGLNEDRAYQKAVRSQMCTGPSDDLNPMNTSSSYWKEQCTDEIPKDTNRVQIKDLNGVHKVYCFPYDIEIDGERQPCPQTPFALEGYREYRIADIFHEGAFEDTTIRREIGVARQKRSPTLGNPQPMVGSTTSSTTPKPTEPRKRIDIVGTLNNVTAKMNVSLQNFRESLSKLPTSINITKADVEDFFSSPLEIIYDGAEQIYKYIKSIGSMVGIMSACMFVILLIPIIEVAFIGLRLVKIPINLWLGSARRVSNKLVELSKYKPRFVPIVFKQKQKRWDDKII